MNDSGSAPQPADSKLERRLQAGAWKEILSQATLGYGHDLNNALTGILGLTEAVSLEAAQGVTGVEPIAQLKQSARQAARLVEQMVAWHRLGSGRRDYHDLNSLVADSVEFLKRAMPRGIKLEMQRFSDALPVQLDPLELHHSVANLVLNAASAMSDRGTVILRTSREEGSFASVRWFGTASTPVRAVVTVQDQGRGLASGDSSRLFEPPGFPRDDRALGLGLLQVRRLLESCGGGVLIAPGEQGGTIVRLFLPLVDLSKDLANE